MEVSEEVARDLALAQKAFLIRKAGLSPLDVENSFETFDPSYGGNHEALEICRAYAQNFEPKSGIGLLLWGNPGTGKGHLCASIVKVVLQRNITARKWKVPELLAQGRSLFVDSDTEDVPHLYRELRENALVWLDEITMDTVGSGAFETARAVETLYRVLDTLVEYRVGMLVTTNQAPERLAAELKRLDPAERIMDRLRGATHEVHIRGDSVRAKIKRARTPDWLAAARKT